MGLIPSDNAIMATALSPELKAEMEEAARLALSNVRDPEVMRQACERMDRMREELRRKHGVLDIGVSAIREFRGEIPS
jgi:hypothetical protein